MATSLVSTGVQFPDSTIQTTAASGSPGASGVGSGVARGNRGLLIGMPASSLYTLANNNIVSSILDMDAGNNYPISGTNNPCYSNYYNSWVTAAPRGSDSTNNKYVNLYLSNTSEGWRVAQEFLIQDSGVTTYQQSSSQMAGPMCAIDESNGRYFVWRNNSAALNLNLVYRGTVPGNYGTYNNAINATNAYSTPEAQYVYPVYNGSTFSGLVTGYFLYGDGYQMGFISAGGTSPTATATASYNSANGTFNNISQGFDHNPTLGRVVWLCSVAGNSYQIIYNTTAGSYTALTTVSTPATSTSNVMTGIACSNTYVAYYNAAGNIYYSTTPASGWTTLTTPFGAGSSIYALYWINGYWIASVLTSASGNTRLIYISTTAIPNTWTLLGPTGTLPSKFSIRKV